MESNSSDAAPSKSERIADKEDGSDEKEMISKLRRSNSVSAKASLFQQLARESKKACEEGLLKKKTGKVCHPFRVHPSRSSSVKFTRFFSSILQKSILTGEN